MTIGIAGARVSLNCDGVTQVFPVPIQAYLATDFLVILTAPASAGGAQAVLTLNSDYSLATSGTLQPPAWTLTGLHATPYAAGYTLSVVVSPVQSQQTQYVQGQAFPSLAMQTNLDRLTQMVQRVQDQVSRSPHTPDGDVNPLMLLPPAAQRALTNLGFDANGNLSTSQALAAGTLSAASIGAFLYPVTAAETAAGVAPTVIQYFEGDIRRYGALTAAANNAPAINSALNVSAAGGRSAYVPAGTWAITTAIQVPAKSSMYGEGALSIIQPTAAVDGLQFALDPTPQPARRYFGRFAIISTNGGANSGISCTVQPSAAWSIDFHDIAIQNFQTAITAQGFRACNLIGISGFNNYNAIDFQGQNTNIEIIGCQFIRGNITGAGGAYGIRGRQLGGNTTQSTQIVACYFFGYDMALKADLFSELQVTACDFSNCLIKGAEITGVISILSLTYCWIEVLNAAGTFGIDVVNITPTTTAKVMINNNYVNFSLTPVAGTVGIHVGNANAGIMVEGNQVIGFDKGIDVGAANNAVVRGNTININTSVYSATSYAVRVNSSANDLTLSNYIVPGTPAAVTMANASPNLLVATPSNYPVGTPIQFDASVNGFFTGVTYYVVGVGGNFIQAGALPGGAAIAATGAVAINVFQAPLPVTFTGATPPPGFKFWARGSFLGALTGFNAAVQGPVNWFADGSVINVVIPASSTFTGTSNATTMSMVNVPSMIWPLTTASMNAQTEDSGAFAYGAASMTNAGVFNFFKTPGGGAFTAAGTKGIGNMPLTWLFT